MINEIQSKAISGKSAHLSPRRALEGLKLDVTGKKILNTPYTIWQLLKHISYWQHIWMKRLDGQEVEEEASWQLGWCEPLNASSQAELDMEITALLSSINELKERLKSDKPIDVIPNQHYDNHHDIVQAMASHLSYHIGELILLRRIFGAWPPPQGGYVW